MAHSIRHLQSFYFSSPHHIDTLAETASNPSIQKRLFSFPDPVSHSFSLLCSADGTDDQSDDIRSEGEADGAQIPRQTKHMYE